MDNISLTTMLQNSLSQNNALIKLHSKTISKFTTLMKKSGKTISSLIKIQKKLVLDDNIGGIGDIGDIVFDGNIDKVGNIGETNNDNNHNTDTDTDNNDNDNDKKDSNVENEENVKKITDRLKFITHIRDILNPSNVNKENIVELSDGESDVDTNFEVFTHDIPQIDIKKIRNYEDIGRIETINDILNIAKKFNDIYSELKEQKKSTEVKYLTKYGLYSFGKKKYRIDPERTVNLILPLKKLNKMIGLKSAKEQVCEIIIHKLQDPPNISMCNTLITGPPGVGKTTFSKIFAKIQSALKLVKSNRVVMTSRADWIGDHYGGTEIKTAELIKKGKGGVIIIDEGYSLGSSNGKDSFAQACITEIIKSMTEQPSDVCFHFLGYEEQMRDNLLKENPGLDRRLPIRINISGYDVGDMTDIMIYFLKKNKVQFDPSVKKCHLESIIRENMKNFTGYAGDIENVVEKCIMINNKIYSEFDPQRKHKKVFTLDTIKKGIERYNQHKEDKGNSIDIQSLYT